MPAGRGTAGRSAAAAALAVALGLGAAGAAWGEVGRRVAVLPLLPSDGSHPREGVGLAVKLASRLERDYEVVTLDWRSLAEVMDEHGLDKSRLADPAVLAQVGRALRVDGVVSGRFAAGPASTVAHPVLVSVRTARAKKGRSWATARDVVVEAPDFFVDPPDFGEDDLPDLKDAMRDYSPCDDAGARVDEFERRILELKARYWAVQLSRGVDMRTLKFNPGSTITDPDLKREFYGRIKQWTLQPTVPELSPVEIKQFAEGDEQAIRLARRCGIL
ncbi:MAG: hypothetical protein HY748_14600 [Elusimicrobia bacterium]|nr:hypothetical protein [Elusimicrobiota bacterium]